MNSLNGEVVSISKKTKPSDIQKRVTLDLSEPLPRPRPRKQLSKFTITSNPPLSSSSSPSCLIPAYRTQGKESLPTISREYPKTKLNISPNGGGSYSPSSITRTRQLLLQRRTIHRSLEDLRRDTGNLVQHNYHLPSFPSSPPKHIPRPSRNSQSQPERSNNEMRGTIATMPPISSQRISPSQRDSVAQTDNIIGGDENSESGDDADVNRNNNSTEEDNSGADEDVDEENMAKLLEENDLLKKRIEEERSKRVIYRIVNAFTFEALRRRREKLVELHQLFERKREECAARIIVHHLLLNSWRMTKGQVTAIKLENTQMHKTIDNQSLQLSIVRKMQSMEKDKASVVLREFNAMKKEYCVTLKENETMKEEYAKVLEEKSSLERHLKSLSEENSKLTVDVQIRVDKREMQLRSMELDKLRADKFLRENQELAKEAEIAKSQIKDLTFQQSHWQEKAMSFESKCFELKLEMENRERVYEKMLAEKMSIANENEILTLSKSKLERDMEEAKTRLEEITMEKKGLEISYKECREKLKALEDQGVFLETAIQENMKGKQDMEAKVCERCLKNVRKRRMWAALYYLVTPFEAFRRFYFGVPNERCSGTGAEDSHRTPTKIFR